MPLASRTRRLPRRLLAYALLAAACGLVFAAAVAATLMIAQGLG